MEIGTYCDLLIVKVEGSTHVVESPDYYTEIGDLVEFVPESEPVIGEVVEKMFVEKNGDAHRCIGLLHPIHPARRIYKLRWEAWEGNDEECGG